MHNLREYDSFVRKFVNLWRSGTYARLCVETEAGNAFVSLHVGLGQACPPQGQEVAGHRGGGPARQRRREKRAAAREEAAKAEQVNREAATYASEDALDSEKATNKNEENEGSNAIKDAEKVSGTQECAIAIDVKDEICDDEHFVNNIEKLDVISEKDAELSTVSLKEGFVRREVGEIVLEVRPQYCKFDEKELAEKLGKHVGLKLLCLPWVANTGPHFYTAGCKITEQSYEKFKDKGGGTLPKGFYTVETSRKMN